MMAIISSTPKKILNLKILRNLNQLVKLVKATLISFLTIKPTIKATKSTSRNILASHKPFNKNLKSISKPSLNLITGKLNRKKILILVL